MLYELPFLPHFLSFSISLSPARPLSLFASYHYLPSSSLHLALSLSICGPPFPLSFSPLCFSLSLLFLSVSRFFIFFPFHCSWKINEIIRKQRKKSESKIWAAFIRPVFSPNAFTRKSRLYLVSTLICDFVDFIRRHDFDMQRPNGVKKILYFSLQMMHNSELCVNLKTRYFR